MWEAADLDGRSEWVARILQADDQFLADNPDSSLFAYFAGTPDKSVLGRLGQLSEWEAAEAERESRASGHGGEYYTRGALASALIARDTEQWDAEQARARVSQLESELQALRSGTLYSMTRRLLDAKATRRLRANRFVAAVERRLRAALS
jgi:hypothetical protein